MIVFLNRQEERTFVERVARAQQQFGRDILNPGKISRMHSGTMLSILCKETGASLNGYLRVRMLMANDQKLRAAIFLRFEMGKYWSKILIERIDP